MRKLLCFPFKILNLFKGLDFIALLGIRLCLVPVLWFAGMRKFNNFDSIVAWFNEGLHLPNPELMAYLVTYTELVGAVCLLFGIAVRIISIPLLILMAVAGYTVHLAHGWYAIAPESNEMSVRLTNFLEWLEHYFPERFAYITELGRPVMLQDGVQMPTIYFLMVLVLFFFGAGKYLSVDYWVNRKYQC